MIIALAQINPKVGDFEGNSDKIINFIDKAKSKGCELVVFPELSLMGYPPRDLLLWPDFVEAAARALKKILPHTRGIGVLVGTALPAEGSAKLYNSALLIEDGQIKGQVNKTLLPDYDVFEEERYFKPSSETHCMVFRGRKLGVSICEDIWVNSEFVRQRGCSRDVLAELYAEAPDIFINMSASPYYYGKHKIRIDLISGIARKYKIPFIYVNQVGGNDELVFDGSSMVFDGEGALIACGKSFEEDMVLFDTDRAYQPIPEAREDISWMFNGLVLGLRDYFHKTGFKKAVVGLSGGVDSSLVACIAVEALGKENVLGVSMPSRYSSEHSRTDARQLAKNLGIEYRVIPIEAIFSEYLKIFNENGQPLGDLAEENIQARIRGSLLMFIANREGRMLISTGNKSEMAVGYSTLYGDMCGGLAVIGDVPKMYVYKLCRYINRNREIIPENVFTKAPSAELRPGQKDEDTLPPYRILDSVLKMYVEENLLADEMVKRGYDRDTVYKILNMINHAEYKRKQAPPVIKITNKAFGIGRRIPIVHGFRWGQEHK